MLEQRLMRTDQPPTMCLDKKTRRYYFNDFGAVGNMPAACRTHSIGSCQCTGQLIIKSCALCCLQQFSYTSGPGYDFCITV